MDADSSARRPMLSGSYSEAAATVSLQINDLEQAKTPLQNGSQEIAGKDIRSTGRQLKLNAWVKCSILVLGFVALSILALWVIKWQHGQDQVNSSCWTDHSLMQSQNDLNTSNLNATRTKTTTKLCKSSELAAKLVQDCVDNSTKPCDDFYQFACGGWLKSRPIHADQTVRSYYSTLSISIMETLNGLIKRLDAARDSPTEALLRNFYSSCTNSSLDARGEASLLAAIKELGGWPVLEDPNSYEAYNTSWLELIGKFREMGFSHDMIIDLSVEEDLGDTDRNILYLSRPSLGLPDNSYYAEGINGTVAAAYYRMMVESAVMLGAPRERAERQMREAFEFESALSFISVTNQDSILSETNLTELQKRASNTNWSLYLSSLMQSPDYTGPMWAVERVVFNLDGLLRQTDRRVLANYMIWRVVRDSMQSISDRWRSLFHSYDHLLTGREQQLPTWMRCLHAMQGPDRLGVQGQLLGVDSLEGRNSLNAALSALMLKHHPDPTGRRLASEMMDYIKRDFLEHLDNIDWLDEVTREEAKAKVQAITQVVGAPDELLHPKILEQYYKGLKFVESDDFFTNTRRLRKWAADSSLGRWNSSNTPERWRQYADINMVNAFYISKQNKIHLPLGVIKLFNWINDPARKYIHFGVFGSVIGHELTHSIDDTNRYYDKDNQIRNWWSSQSNKSFEERAQCFVYQYGNYTVEQTGTKLDGQQVLGEAIPDNGAVGLAFKAYKSWIKDHGPQEYLPGLDYTPDQLFWIWAAMGDCGHMRPEVLKFYQELDPHPPSKYRVIGPFSNSEELAKSFNCPIGSPMNPATKCAVW